MATSELSPAFNLPAFPLCFGGLGTQRQLCKPALSRTGLCLGFFFLSISLWAWIPLSWLPALIFILSWGFLRIASVLRSRRKVLSSECGGVRVLFPSMFPGGN